MLVRSADVPIPKFPKYIFAKLVHPLNILSTVFKELELKLLKSKLVKLLQPLNMPAIAATEDVTKLLKSKLVKLLQLLNMYCI